MNTTPTTEDRIWAVLAHLSALALGMGILLPVIGWSEQRRKSNYASFQCLQALGYQSLGYTVWLLTYLLSMVVVVIVSIVALSLGGDGGDVDVLMGTWMSAFLFIIFGIFGVYILFPVTAAIACGLGKDFRYPFMGNRLARYLKYDPTKEDWLNEDYEDRWVVGMGHFAVIIALWGMLVPFTAWIMQGKRNLFLRFQSLQTLVFQVGTLILYFGAGFLYFIGIILLAATSGLMGAEGVGSPAGMFGIVLFIAASLIAFVIILLVPFLHILGQYAGYRVLKGHDYRYPLVGRLVERWISNLNKTQRRGDNAH